ncbi:MAG: DNA-binding protein WhiA [Oscillospiraceae bacterium]|nr:DNA-binding protein WhiA [Oscillospiraceae bacterium]
MSFSSEIKQSLCDVKDLSPDDAPAMLYGMFFAGKTRGKKQLLQTENLWLVTAAQTLCKAVFPDARVETKRLVKNGGSLYTFEIKPSDVLREKFGDFSVINSDIVSGNDSGGGAFLRGIFVVCGYVTDPKKEYHLEIVLPESDRAEALMDFINEHGMTVKSTVRQRTTVLYAKTSEIIEDFLTYIGAGAHSLEIMRVKIEKDIRNRANRSVNCDSANLDKTVAASEKIRRDIEFIFSTAGESSLSPELCETARLRLENPESSLSELCGMFNAPISRSGLNHRLQKLAQIAEELRKAD